MPRTQILEFQARWMRPAGIAGIVAAALLVVAGVVGSVGSADDTAEQLELYQDHAGRLELSSVISGLGLLLVSIPLYFLFRSAFARSDRMRSFAGPLIALGALLVAVQGVLFALGLKDASDQYVAGVPAVEAKARQAATTSGAAQPRSVEDRVSDAKDDFAEDQVQDSGKTQIAVFIRLFGGLALLAGAVYTLVWTMRTGLLTRFMATLGMIFIGTLLLIPQLGLFGLILWFAVLGLMLAGWWIRPLPPAWAAGEAIPWPRPGDEVETPPAEGPPRTVEGSGREVSEPPLAENGATTQQPEGRGQRRKKRKRRK